MKKIKLRKIKHSNQAVAGIIVAMLLIGLFFTALGFVQSVYVPQWMEKKEAEHMDDVVNQFSQLKFAIDTIGVTKQKNSIISTSVTLGSREMPFLSSIRAYGSLEIEPNEGKIFFTHGLNNKETSFSLGRIQYSSQNGYHVNQKYIYENGGVILSQNKGDSIIIQPSFSVENSGNLYFNIVKLIPLGDKTSAGGYGTYPIQTKFLDSDTHNLYNLKEMKIISNYQNAWRKYLSNCLSDYSIVHTITDETDGSGNVIGFKIIFDSPASIEINKIDISCQISPGWVK